MLCGHYGTPKMTESGHELLHVINSDEAGGEWILFKQLISNSYRGCILQSMATELLQSDVVKDQHPNMLTLITLVERIQQTQPNQNQDKRTIKNTLHSYTDENVNRHPRTQLNEQFHFDKAFEVWCNTKDRRICRV